MTAAASEMKALSTERKQAYSYLRVLSCLAVVIIHTMNVSEILHRDQLDMIQRWATLCPVYILMWAVPCFVMVSGALLLDPDRDIPFRRLFQRYILRVVLALLLSALLFRLFDIYMNKEVWTAANVLSAFSRAFTGSSWAHLWYLYLLLGLYLLLPVYRLVSRHATAELLRYLLLIYAIFLSLLPLTRIAGVTSALYIHVSGIYPFYFFAGYALSRRIVTIRSSVAWCMLIGSTCLIGFLTYLRLSVPLDTLDILLTSYSSPLVIAQALGLFALFWNHENHLRASRSVALIDQNSFGIYLFHMIFIRLTLRYMGLNPYEQGLWLFPLLIVLNFLLTGLVVFALRQIRWLRRVI